MIEDYIGYTKDMISHHHTDKILIIRNEERMLSHFGMQTEKKTARKIERQMWCGQTMDSCVKLIKLMSYLFWILLYWFIPNAANR